VTTTRARTHDQPQSQDAAERGQRLSGEDLSFWWLDAPTQPTTMAILMLLDRVPDPGRLRRAFERAVAAVPRLAERVVEAPLELTLPHWQRDPTFDLDYHVRRHGLAKGGLAELFAEVSPAYEQPFDRSRPLWEARLYEGVGEGCEAALFFKLHHAVADGIGGNAILASLTDSDRDDDLDAPPAPVHEKGAWPGDPGFVQQVTGALLDRAELEVERVQAVAGALVDTIRHPSNLGHAYEILRSVASSFSFDSHSPMKTRTGRARRLSGLELPFEEMRELKKALGVSMIDVILAISARAMGRWYASRGIRDVHEIMTLVPIAMRAPEMWGGEGGVGNKASGILVELPIGIEDPLRTVKEVHRRMALKKADPAAAASPQLASMLSVLPRRFFTWMAEATFQNIDFVVTNVPGIRVPRFLAGAELLGAYPFAPTARTSPASIALYGYRDSLFIGLDADVATMPDDDAFRGMLAESFEELRRAAWA
jgi:diacylglycerol O-acyltransferase